MAGSAILAVKIIADASKAQAGLQQSEQQASKWSSGLNKAAGVAAVGLAAVGAVMVDGVKAAAEDAQAQAVLAQALKNSAGATDKQIASTEDWISKTALATGVADDQLRPALATLVRATGDVSTAQKGMGLALDIAAATGKDVEAVSVALAKGYGGQTTALGRLVPGLDKATLASGDMTKVTAELASLVGGSAAASANTAAGQYQRFQVAIDETKEGIGAALLPVLQQLTGFMLKVSQAAAGNTQAITVAIGVFSALAGIVVTVNAVTKAWSAIQAVATAATKVWAAAQRVLNLVLASNPIGLVIVAVAALAAGLVMAYQKSETFRRIVDSAFDAVKDAAQACWNWIKANWPLLLAILTGPVGIAVTVIARHWGDIKEGAQAVIGWLRGSWDSIRSILTSPFESAWNTISGIIERIKSAVSSVSSAIRSIPKPSLPNIPGLNATAGGVGVSYGRAYRGVARAPAAGAAMSAGGGITVNVNGALDPVAVGRQLRQLLERDAIRSGRGTPYQLGTRGAVVT